MMENHAFVLLLDIMHSFNIHEDYYLVAISNFNKANMNFKEDDFNHNLHLRIMLTDTDTAKHI